MNERAIKLLLNLESNIIGAQQHTEKAKTMSDISIDEYFQKHKPNTDDGNLFILGMFEKNRVFAEIINEGVTAIDRLLNEIRSTVYELLSLVRDGDGK